MSIPRFRQNPLAPPARNSTSFNALSILRRLRAVEIAAITTAAVPHCDSYVSAAQNHTSTGNFQVVLLDAETEDTNTMHSTSSNTSRITAPYAGLYIVNAQAWFAANATGIRALRVQKNAGGVAASGTIIDAGTQIIGSTSNVNVMRSSRVVRLAANDYIEMFAFQNSGGNLAYTTGDDSTFLQLAWLGP